MIEWPDELIKKRAWGYYNFIHDNGTHVQPLSVYYKMFLCGFLLKSHTGKQYPCRQTLKVSRKLAEEKLYLHNEREFFPSPISMSSDRV